MITSQLVFGIIFLFFSFYSAFYVRQYYGTNAFFFILIVCIFTDLGGYVFGKTFGGKKLSKISPNKTITGTIGSFIFSVIPLLIIHNTDYLNLEFNMNNIVFTLLISLVSQLGDLFVSYLKRKAEVKDTGKILPGHGGALDRVDGIIFAVPFSYFLINFI